MEIIDNRNIIVGENIKTGDILEVINPEDRSREYWIVGNNAFFVEKGQYSLVNLGNGDAILTKNLNSTFKYYFLGCDIRVVDTELHIIE